MGLSRGPARMAAQLKLVSTSESMVVYMLSTVHIYSTNGVSMPRSGGILGLSNRSITFPLLGSSLRSMCVVIGYLV